MPTFLVRYRGMALQSAGFTIGVATVRPPPPPPPPPPPTHPSTHPPSHCPLIHSTIHPPFIYHPAPHSNRLLFLHLPLTHPPTYPNKNKQVAGGIGGLFLGASTSDYFKRKKWRNAYFLVSAWYTIPVRPSSSPPATHGTSFQPPRCPLPLCVYEADSNHPPTLPQGAALMWASINIDNEVATSMLITLAEVFVWTYNSPISR